jgi:hypothetical protein
MTAGHMAPATVGKALLVVAATGFLGIASAANCDTRPPGVAYVTPPFSVAQLRDRIVAGLSVVTRMHSAVAGEFHRRLTVESISDSGVVLLEETLEPELQSEVPASRTPLRWEELRDIACFPSPAAGRERTTRDTAFGSLPGWEYVASSEQVTVTLFFADDLPGLPVQSERQENALIILRAQQIQRSDIDMQPTE